MIMLADCTEVLPKPRFGHLPGDPILQSCRTLSFLIFKAFKMDESGINRNIGQFDLSLYVPSTIFQL